MRSKGHYWQIKHVVSYVPCFRWVSCLKLPAQYKTLKISNGSELFQKGTSLSANLSFVLLLFWFCFLFASDIVNVKFYCFKLPLAKVYEDDERQTDRVITRRGSR